MAKLPSQEAAGLAFAEVHTVIGYLHKKKGYAGIRALFREAEVGARYEQSTQAGLWF